MAYTLACRDAGQPTCPFVARGNTVDETLAQAAKHGKEAHRYTDKQLNDPKMIEQLKAKIKKV